MKWFAIFMFYVFTTNAQNISGKVIDKQTKKPLENVTVYLKRQNVGTTSNDKGTYLLKVKSDIKPTDSVLFSMLGYTTKQIPLSQLRKANYTVYLTKQLEYLDEISIYSKKKINTTIPFTKMAPLKKAVYNFGSVQIGNKLYVIGGDGSFYQDSEKEALDNALTFGEFLRTLKDNFTWENYSDLLQIYNIENDTWESKDLEFEPRAYHKLVDVNNKIYVLGGKTLSLSRKREYLGNNIEVFDINSNKITVDKTNPHQAVNFTAVSYNDNIIVMGGSIKQNYKGEKGYINTSHIYNISSGYWYELPPMKIPKETNGIRIKNKIYLVGGFNTLPLKSIETYDLVSGTWAHEINLIYPIERPALTANKNIIYIYNENKILTYNIITKVINAYDINLHLKHAQMHYFQNHLYVLGGFVEEEYTKAPSPNVYKINLDDFKTTLITASNKK